MIRFVDKDIKAVVVSMYHLFKNIKRSVSMIRGDRDDIKKTQSKILETKSIIPVMKNTLMEFTAD